MRPKLDIETVVEAEGWVTALGVDPDGFAARILRAASKGESAHGAVSVLFADDAAVRVLNRTWRGKDTATNVLSFPAPAGFGAVGDIALALETIVAEAQHRGKPVSTHAAHLIAHGFLHLVGYDHEADADAERMEARERAIMTELGLPDPYGDAP